MDRNDRTFWARFTLLVMLVTAPLAWSVAIGTLTLLWALAVAPVVGAGTLAILDGMRSRVTVAE